MFNEVLYLILKNISRRNLNSSRRNDYRSERKTTSKFEILKPTNAPCSSTATVRYNLSHALVSNTNTLDDLRPPPEPNTGQCQSYAQGNNKERTSYVLKHGSKIFMI